MRSGSGRTDGSAGIVAAVAVSEDLAEAPVGGGSPAAPDGVEVAIDGKSGGAAEPPTTLAIEPSWLCAAEISDRRRTSPNRGRCPPRRCSSREERWTTNDAPQRRAHERARALRANIALHSAPDARHGRTLRRRLRLAPPPVRHPAHGRLRRLDAEFDGPSSTDAEFPRPRANSRYRRPPPPPSSSDTRKRRHAGRSFQNSIARRRRRV